MKKLLTLLFLLMPFHSYGQDVQHTQKPIVCFVGEGFSEILNKQYGEVPYFGGKLREFKEVYFGIYFNEKTKTYTVVEFNKDKTCVLSSGVEGQLINSNKKYD